MKRFSYTASMDTFIREHYQLTAPKLAERFNAQFGTSRSSKQLHQARKARGLKTGRTGLFLKGQSPAGTPFKKGMPPNSTSFKKGGRPHNAVAVGTERFTSKDRYIKVKIAEPNRWAFKHAINWESAHGKIPAGHVIWFIDQNRENCEVSNLELITRTEQVRRNKLQVTTVPAQYQTTIKLLAKVQDKAGSARRAVA